MGRVCGHRRAGGDGGRGTRGSGTSSGAFSPGGKHKVGARACAARSPQSSFQRHQREERPSRGCAIMELCCGQVGCPAVENILGRLPLRPCSCIRFLIHSLTRSYLEIKTSLGLAQTLSGGVY